MVQPSPGSSTIELPSAFAESGAYPPDRALPDSPRQCFLPLACRHPPEGHQIGARKGRAPGNTILSQPYRRRVSTDRPNREGKQLAASLEGELGPTPYGKTLPHSYLETRFRRKRARGVQYNGGFLPDIILLARCYFFFFFFSFISLIADGPHHYHPACGHKGSSHLSPVHALQFFYSDASSALLQLVNQWLNFTYSRSHAFRYERKNTNPTLVRIELTTSVLADVQLTY